MSDIYEPRISCPSEFVPEEFDCEDNCYHCGKELAKKEPPGEEAFKVWNGGFCSPKCEEDSA